MFKHAPARWSAYQSAHDGWMNSLYKEGFIQHDTLRWRAVPGALFLEGQIACLGGLVLTVEKILDVRGDEGAEMVETTRYNYNLSVKGYGNVMRRDNADHHGFATPHHRHTFDWQRGREHSDSPQHVGVEGWLTLGEAIREAAAWYWKNRESLPDPDGVPEIDEVYVARNSSD